jgi:hypothetical protein
LDIFISQRPVCFENIKSFLLKELKKKTFQSTRGTNFHAGISVPPLKDLYACPAFRSILVQLISHSDGTALFLFLLFGFLFSFSMVKSVVCGSFNAETLTSSNEELLLSEMSE